MLVSILTIVIMTAFYIIIYYHINIMVAVIIVL